MKVMLLAAGRGERLRPLTDKIPKPLINIKDAPLIVHHLWRLAAAGLTEIVINVHHLGELIQNALGDGSDYGVRIQYSVETQLLETGGGIVKALPLLGSEPFAVINSDIWTDYPWRQLPQQPAGLAHLVLADNPPHVPQGDYSLQDGLVSLSGQQSLTFTGIGVYRPELFAHPPAEIFRLPQVLEPAMGDQQVSGEHYMGQWVDIGSPERLATLL